MVTKVRLAKMTDRHFIFEGVYQGWQEGAFNPIICTDDPNVTLEGYLKDEILVAIEGRGDSIYVSVTDGVISGFCWVCLEFEGLVSIVNLHMIFIHPTARGFGISQPLIDAGIKHYPAVALVTAETFPVSKRIRKILKARGFKQPFTWFRKQEKIKMHQRIGS